MEDGRKERPVMEDTVTGGVGEGRLSLKEAMVAEKFLRESIFFSAS